MDGVRPPTRPWWPFGLALGLLACLVLLILNVDSLVWVVLARGTGLIAVFLFAVAAWRMPARTRLVWWLLWGYAALTISADVIYDVQQRVLGEPPFPGPADALYLLAYVSAIAGLFVLVHRAVSGRDVDAAIDTVAVSVAVATVVWYFIVRPMVAQSEQTDLGIVIALAYPFLDIVVLSALVRLVVARGRPSPSALLLVVGFLTTLSGDLLYNLVIQNGSEDFSPPWLDALFLAAVVLIAAAAWAPGANAIDAPTEHRPDSNGNLRLLGLAIGVLALPVLIIAISWTGGSRPVRVIAIASVCVILLVVWRLARVLATVRRQHELLNREARTDALTGLPNRRTLDYEIERAVEVADLTGHDITIAMLDLDHFKEFNDRNGHQAGDRLLATCGRTWQATLPAGAFLARYGGEEFAVLLPGIDAAAARVILEGLRAAMPPHRTVSIGFAVRDGRETGQATLRRADAALYEAKAAGRDRVVASW